jgi:hypothetical protein
MSRQFKVPVNLVQLTTDPSTALAGDIYFNSVSSKIKFYSGTEWLEVGAGAGGGGTTNHTHDYNGNVIVGAGGSLVTTATFAAGVPNNLNGQNGDVYVDITNLNIYTKASGVWGSPTEINVYTKSEVDTLLSGKSATGHTHTLSSITDVTATASELNVLDGITATTAELNILDGVTVTAAEINYLSGVASNIQDQLDSVGNSLGDYIPLAALGVASGVAATDANGNILVPTSPAGAGIKFADNTIQTTALNTSSFATSSQLSDVEVLALAGL